MNVFANTHQLSGFPAAHGQLILPRTNLTVALNEVHLGGFSAAGLNVKILLPTVETQGHLSGCNARLLQIPLSYFRI